MTAGSLQGANAQMAKCKEFSSKAAFQTYYQNFLKWDLTIGSVKGPDHVFFFTFRDALNFGVGEHFGLISTCDSTDCKLTEADSEEEPEEEPEDEKDEELDMQMVV
ncbi:unnamed protein product [Effrenium voratum]|uniref:Uncharacterized protein n=1 Tax=Effrenium voratum TaxID=2562239 RepID=A0AA36HKY4_9DINO|nr:unnamed protein product [Effrenium voratum]